MRAGLALGMAGATIAAAAAASYGAVHWAGESGGGSAPSLVGALGGRAMVTGGVVGIAAGSLFGRIGGSHLFTEARGMLLLPVGIAGAALGGVLARRGLERGHAEEYAAQTSAIDDAVVAAQAMFRTAGVDEARLERVPERYDRSYFNASYNPPLGPFGDDIVVGRDAGGGGPLAALDVVAHEYAHRVVYQYAPLLGRSVGGDARSIHESLADTFAMAVDTDDWLLGEDVTPGGMRSFSHPEQRGSFNDGETTPAPITRDSLGNAEAHLGAGVGNKAAWRIGSQLGRPEMARLYVAALARGELGFNGSYQDLAHAVRGAAVDLYGSGSREAQVVDAAWRQAGY